MNPSLQSIALIGNPNCGKTTLFNALTGGNQRVGNWPGVTVDKKSGSFSLNNHTIEVIDLPGTYAFEMNDEYISQDELVVRHFLHHDRESLLINILDASNLQRNLYLTFQLLDLGRPMIIVLNMIDVAKINGLDIDLPYLEKVLNCPIIPISASKKTGLDALKVAITNYETPAKEVQNFNRLGPQNALIIQDFIATLPKESILRTISTWDLTEILFGSSHYDDQLSENEKKAIQQCREQLGQKTDGELDVALASSRYDAIDALCRKVIKTVGVASSALTEKLDRFTLGRITGIPIFLGVMFLMFMIAINVGSSFIDFFEILAGAIFVDGLEALLTSINAPNWTIAIFAKGIGAGIQTVASFIPVIAAMFFSLSFLEDSGYLARAAIVVDRGMRAIGLPGKAFVPMLVGFGCNIPAIMGTRTLESTRDRLLSIMMIPFMSCGARLPVYALFAAIFFPKSAGAVVYLLYLIGILVAIFTGFILKNSILQGENTPFIMELPQYHRPTLKGLLLLTWDRLKAFIYKAGRAIIIVVALLGVLNTWGTDGSFGNENSQNSVLSSIGKGMTPLFSPMGITKENWPATVGIFTGIFAKESVIGTLNSLYAQMDDDSSMQNEKEFNFLDSTKDAFGSIVTNLQELPSKFLDPLGIQDEVADGDLKAVQDSNEIDDSAITHLQSLFTSSAAVMAYLIFILLYTPCVAALGAIYREAGMKWMVFVAIWTFAIGWITATGYYQISLLGTALGTSALLWLLGLVGVLIGIFILLRVLNRYHLLSESHHIVNCSHLDSTAPNKGGNCH